MLGRKDREMVTPELSADRLSIIPTVRIGRQRPSGSIGLRGYLQAQGFTVAPDNYSREAYQRRKGETRDQAHADAD